MSSAPKEHNISAQGNALGAKFQHAPDALKGRNQFATEGCFAPSGLGPLNGSSTQGVALGWYVLAFQAVGFPSTLAIRQTLSDKFAKNACELWSGLSFSSLKRLHQLVLQSVAGLLQVGHQPLVVGEQLVGVRVRDAGVVRVLDVKVVASGLDLLDRHLPSLLGLLPLLPPLLFDVKLFDADRLRLVVRLGSRQIRVLVEPNLFRRLPLGEEQQVRLDPRVRTEDAVRQPDDRVQVALGQQLFLDRRFDPFAEQRAVGKHDRAPSAVFQQREDQHQKQVGGFSRAELLRKIGFDAVLLHAAERWIGDDRIDAILGRPRSNDSICVRRKAVSCLAAENLLTEKCDPSA